MGAAVAAPERFARFVLMNTAAFRAQRCPWSIRALPHSAPRAAGGARAEPLRPRRASRGGGEARANHARGPGGLLGPVRLVAASRGGLRFVLDIPLRPSHPSYQTLLKIEEGLGQFRHSPVCLIWGMRDWCFTPEFLDRFLDFFPQAEVHRLADAGHYVVEDAHEKIVPLLDDFLRRHA